MVILSQILYPLSFFGQRPWRGWCPCWVSISWTFSPMTPALNAAPPHVESGAAWRWKWRYLAFNVAAWPWMQRCPALNTLMNPVPKKTHGSWTRCKRWNSLPIGMTHTYWQTDAKTQICFPGSKFAFPRIWPWSIMNLERAMYLVFTFLGFLCKFVFLRTRGGNKEWFFHCFFCIDPHLITMTKIENRGFALIFSGKRPFNTLSKTNLSDIVIVTMNFHQHLAWQMLDSKCLRLKELQIALEAF